MLKSPWRLAQARRLAHELAAGGSSLKFLFHDEFTTPQGAPLANPLDMEPGPGQWSVVDSGNNFSKAGGKLVVGGVVGAGDPSLTHVQSVARNAGVMLAYQLDDITGVSTDILTGFANNAYLNLTGLFQIFSTGIGMPDVIINNRNASGVTTAALVIAETHVKLVYKSEVDYPNWTLLHVGYGFGNIPANFSSILYRNFANADFYWVRCANLGGPWDTDYGIVEQRLAGARTPVDPFAHPADFFFNFTVTALPSAGNIDIRFRIQDATHYMQIVINSAGDITLWQQGGIPINRGSAAGVIANGERVSMFVRGSEYWIKDDATLVIENLIAGAYVTETDGQLAGLGTGGAVSDIEIWPTTLTGPALNVLNLWTS